MQRKILIVFLIMFCVFYIFFSFPKNPYFTYVVRDTLELCTLRNYTTGPGEDLTYVVYYYLNGVWVPAGEVYFKSSLVKYRNKVCYYFRATGKTYPFYEWFFIVRDTFEAITDTTYLFPLYFHRKILEGDFYMQEKVFFERERGKIYSILKKLDRPVEVDSFPFFNCVFDVLSGVLWARNISLEKVDINGKVYMTLFLDKDTHKIYIRYLGKEIIELEGKKYRTLKGAPLLVQGTIFKGGEEMTVWIADDSTRLPLYVESPIIVGSIRGYLKEAKSLRHKLTCIVE